MKFFLLHGYGANGKNLQDLEDVFSKKLNHNFEFIKPDGIFPLSYYESFAWFDLYDKTKWLSDIIKSAEYIIKLSNGEPCFLSGFSQGGFLSLYLTLYTKINVKGCFCFSSGIIQNPFLSLNKDNLNKDFKHNIPIGLTHGTDDEIITKSYFNEVCDFARANNLNFNSYIIKNMGHEINLESLNHSITFFNKILTMQEKIK